VTHEMELYDDAVMRQGAPHTVTNVVPVVSGAKPRPLMEMGTPPPKDAAPG
jgi:hypothetical protein